jgi:hypothetical protein
VKGKSLRKINTLIHPLFKCGQCFQQLFSMVKEIISPKSHRGIYQIPCTCGKTYIGETWRTINTRIKEHKTYITHNRVNKSSLAEHAHKTKHQIMIEDVKFLSGMDHWSKRWISEAIEISKNPNFLNRDDSLILSITFLPIFYNPQLVFPHFRSLCLISCHPYSSWCWLFSLCVTWSCFLKCSPLLTIIHMIHFIILFVMLYWVL